MNILINRTLLFSIPAALILFSFITFPAQELGTDLLDPGNEVTEIQGGFSFLEGPIADSVGNIYFSDIPENKIYLWTLDNNISVFVHESDGANGLYFDNNGILLACHGAGRKISSISSDGQITDIVTEYEGGKLNSPNDLWVDSSNGIYFTDPRYGNTSNEEQDGYHVYYISPDRQTLTRVIDDMTKPNGILGTPDNKTLYVADQGGGKTFKYNITGPGVISGKTEFADRGSDGMALDEKGNLYLTGSEVFVYDSTGTELGSIEIPQSPANLTFGGAEGKTLFITARTGFYFVEMEVKGAYKVDRPVTSIRPSAQNRFKLKWIQ